MTKLYAQPDDLLRAIESYQRAKRRDRYVRVTVLIGLIALCWIAYLGQWLTVAGR